MKHKLKLTVLGLAGYGGYTLWNRYGSRLGRRVEDGDGGLPDRRIIERSELTVTELSVGSDDRLAQATAILADSDERTLLARDADGIEHRQSQDTVEP